MMFKVSVYFDTLDNIYINFKENPEKAQLKNSMCADPVIAINGYSYICRIWKVLLNDGNKRTKGNHSTTL